MIPHLLLTARTAVHLRPRQVAARILRLVRGLAGGPGLRPPPRPVRLRSETLTLAAPLSDRLASDSFSALRARAECVRAGTFRAVGKSVPVEGIRWTAGHGSHLFRYHLHYFDDAPALSHLAREGDVSAETRLRGLWEDWLEACGAGEGDGWDPYPLSARIPNWIQALILLDGDGRSLPGAGERGGPPVPSHADSTTVLWPELRDRILGSLWTQADRLRRTLEHDLAGNHLLRNRTALVWAAAALDPAPLGLQRAVDALATEVERQVLADGMHEERTPAYHAQVLRDVLEVLELLRAVDLAAPPGLVECARRMRGVLGLFVRRGDDGLHPFGDTTPRGHPTPAVVDRLARDVLGSPSTSTRTGGPWHLEEAGFAGLCTGDLELVLDCGPFGARHQPGHGHCDGLSFVLSVRGTPVVVDPGIGGYADDPHRTWARSTAAHNTVQVDGREQTEIWGTFRAARRARPGPAEVAAGEGATNVYGAMTPFHAREVVHEREVLIRQGVGEGEGDEAMDQVEIKDRIRGARNRRLDTRLHFAPGTVVDDLGSNRWRLRCGGVTIDLEGYGVEGCRSETGRVFPGWGSVEEAPVLHAWIADCPGESTTLGFLLRIHPRLSDGGLR